MYRVDFLLLKVREKTAEKLVPQRSVAPLLHLQTAASLQIWGADTQRLDGCDVLAILDDEEPRIACRGSRPAVQRTAADRERFLPTKPSEITGAFARC